MIKEVTYEQDRLSFFKRQLAAAERRLEWAVKNSDDHNLLSERGYEVGFYAWAVEMAEKDAVEVVRCKDCKHFRHNEENETYCSSGGLTDPREYDYCSLGERWNNI